MSNRLTVELDLNLQRAKKQISELAETGTNLGLNEKDLKRVTELEKRVDDLGKTLKDLTNITNNKVNTKQFTDATKKIQESINQLQKNFDSMTSTLSALDKVQFTHSMEHAVDAAAGLTSQVNNVATAVHALQKNFDDVEFVNAKDKKKLEDTLKLYQGIESTLHEIKEVNTSRRKGEGDLDYFNRLIISISKLNKEYDQYRDDIDNFNGNKESKEFLELQKNYVSTGQAIKELINVIEELSKTSSKIKPFENIKIDGFNLNYLRDIINDEFTEIIDDINSNINRITRLIQDMDISDELTEAQGKTARANKNRTSKGIATSLYISTSPDTLKKQVTTLLDFVQASIEPIDVEVRLTSKYTNKRFNEEFKKLVGDVEQLTIDPNIKTTFLEDVLAIKDRLEREATLNIKTDVSAAEQEIRKVLGRIRKELNKSQNKLHVSPDVEIPKSKIKQIQTELNKLAKELTLRLDHVVISDKAIQEALNNKNKKEKLIDAKAIADTTTLASLIDRIVKSNKEFITSDESISESLIQIKEIVESIPIESIVNPIRDLVDILSKVTGILSKEDLDKMFDGMRVDVEDIVGSLKDPANLKQIKSVLSDFQKYRAAGGDKDITELGGSKNVKQWLKKNYSENIKLKPENSLDFNSLKAQSDVEAGKLGESFSNEYAQGIREGIPEVENAARELVDAAVNSINRTQGTENGNNYGDGYSEGIKDTEAKAENAGANLAEAARKGTAEAQDSHSPSKVAEKLGEYWGEGYVNGILNTSNKVKNAIRALVEEGKLEITDLINDDTHGKESDAVYSDIANNVKSNNYVKSYQKYIKNNLREGVLGSFYIDDEIRQTIVNLRKEINGLLNDIKSKDISKFTIDEIEKIDKKLYDLIKVFRNLKDNNFFIDSKSEFAPFREIQNFTWDWAEQYEEKNSKASSQINNQKKYKEEIDKTNESLKEQQKLQNNESSISSGSNKIIQDQNKVQEEIEQTKDSVSELINKLHDLSKTQEKYDYSEHAAGFNSKNGYYSSIIHGDNDAVDPNQIKDDFINKKIDSFIHTHQGVLGAFGADDINAALQQQMYGVMYQYIISATNALKMDVSKVAPEDLESIFKIYYDTYVEEFEKLKRNATVGDLYSSVEEFQKEYSKFINLSLGDETISPFLKDLNVSDEVKQYLKESVTNINDNIIKYIKDNWGNISNDFYVEGNRNTLLQILSELENVLSQAPKSLNIESVKDTIIKNYKNFLGMYTYMGEDTVFESLFDNAIHDNQEFTKIFVNKMNGLLQSLLMSVGGTLEEYTKENFLKSFNITSDKTPVSSETNPDNNIDQEADKIVKAENKKQKAKKDTKKATEDTIATQQKEKTELEDTSAIDKYQAELNQSERSLLDFTGALGENSLAITEQEKLLAQLTKGKAFPDTAYQGLFRMSNGKDESKKAIANELLGLYTDFGNFLDTDTLNEIWSKTKNSDLSKKMKNSIMKYISKIAKELKEGLEQGVQEASTELQSKKTKTITMSKSEYKDYVKKNKLIPLGKNGEAFEHNFEMQLRGLQEKGLATQKINKNGSKGRWIIQVEVEDNGELEDINKQIEDTKSKTKDLSKTQKTIKDTSKAIKQLSNETEELTKEEQEYLNQQEKKRLDSEQNIGTTLTEIEKTKEATKAKQEQTKAEKELANVKEKSNTINKESDISPVRQAGRNIGSELAEGIRDTVEQVKESAELSKIIKETGEQAESASKGKDKFTESNKQVKESAENSINSLSEEAKLFKEIGDNSKEAAKGKTEFTKANKDVKKSADNTASSKSKEKDKEEYDVKEAKKRQKQIEKLVSKTQSELDEGVISSVDRSYDSHGYLVQALIRLEKAVQEDENLVKRIERINVRYDKEGGIAYTSTQTSDDYTYGDKVEEKRAKSEEKIRKEQEKQEQKDIEAQNQARINLINEMADGRIKAEINAKNREYEAERKQAEAINKYLQKDWEDNQRKLANAMAKGREEEKKKREKAEADAIKQSEKERQSDLKLNDDLGNAQSKMKTLQITLEDQGRYVGTLKEKYDELSQSLSIISTPEQLTRWKALLDVFKELDKQDKILNGYTNGKAKELENVQKTYQNLLTKDGVYNQFNEAFLSDKGIDEARSKITEISNLINELREKTDIEYVDDDEKKQLEILIQEYKEYAKVLGKNEKIANDNSRAKLLKKITDALKENTKYSRKAKVELDGYRDQLKNTVITASDLSKIGTRFLEIQEAEKAAGREGDNFFTKVIKRAKNMSASFLGMYLSLYDIIRYAREAFGVIQQLDTALVDLRKTTTMTSSELEDFYYNSSNLAKQMGVTSEEIINQAAAWSRLNKIGLLYGNV